MIFLFQSMRVLWGIFFILQIFGIFASLVWLGRSSESRDIILFLLRILALVVSGKIFFWLRGVIDRLHLKRYGVPHPSFAPKKTVAADGAPRAGGQWLSLAMWTGRGARPWRRRRLLLTSLTLIGGIVLTDIAMHGLSLGSACGQGFGMRHQARVDQMVVSVFSEPLPADRVIERFSCGGFQDLSVSFQLRLPNAEGRALAAALIRTFEAGPSNPRFMGKPSMSRVTQPGGTELSFTLPGVGTLHVRTLVLHLPDDPNRPVTLVFEGGQF